MRTMRRVVLLAGVLAGAYVGAGAWFFGGTTSPCPPYGTSLLAWDGDYPSDTDKACLASGSGVDGTASGGSVGTDYGESGSVGLRVSGADHYITWPVADGDIPETSGAGTIYMRIRAGTSDGTDANTLLCEIEENTDGVDFAYIMVTDDERLRIAWKGNNTQDTVSSGVGTITRDSSTWVTIGVSWKIETAAGNDLAVTVNGGSTWVEEDDDPVAMTVQQNYATIGNYRISSGNDPFDICAIVILDGYKTALPASFP